MTGSGASPAIRLNVVVSIVSPSVSVSVLGTLGTGTADVVRPETDDVHLEVDVKWTRRL
jgi:hypothetical protein